MPTILFGIVFIIVLLTGVLEIVLCPSVYRLLSTTNSPTLSLLIISLFSKLVNSSFIKISGGIITPWLSRYESKYFDGLAVVSFPSGVFLYSILYSALLSSVT